MNIRTALAHIALLAVLAVSFPAYGQSDNWRTTPWPSQTPGGNHICFVAYEGTPRLLSVTAVSNGSYQMSIVDPIFEGLADGDRVSLTFPSGWSVSGGVTVVSGGALLGLDEAYFQRILDELLIAGTLAVSTAGSAFSIPVPEQLEGRINNLRGSGPVAAGSSCLEQLRQL